MQVHIGQMSFPHVHETLAAARSRFQCSLLQLQAEHYGTALVVTHGDALGAVIEQVPLRYLRSSVPESRVLPE